ncbi:MAG: antitoxin [bacterium]
MKNVRLTREEKAIERALIRGEYHAASKTEFNSIAKAIASRKKDAVLNIRVNSEDLNHIRQKAKRMGIPYQTFISEIIHHFAA